MERLAGEPELQTYEGHRLICGDCLTVLPTLEAGSVDVVVTSPPYNLGLAYRGYDDRRDEDEYLSWLERVAVQIHRIMKPDGSFFLNISGSNSAPWVPFEMIVRLRSLFMLQNHIVWIKSIATKGDSVGHFKPVGGQRFLHHNHEHIFHLTRNGSVKLDRLAIGVPFKDKSNIARRGHPKDLRCRGNTWFIPYDTVRSKAEKFHHPSTFPLALPQWCIRLHGQSGAVVLDPFMGTGTTVLAAALENAIGIGIDRDPAYVAVARRRLSEVQCEQYRMAEL
ncbi:MAG TPA: site-specific DNA-methyltransferase [Acetobacteraceae bacterium]|jgi:site-specific DNA-methyltransferase (adenine-specific)|nr:site-specific DNA-methyltransferase [Acetobacteraceae bacterium]